MSAPRIRTPATLEDFLAEERAGNAVEMVDGDVVQKAQPLFRHASVQSALALQLGPARARRRGGGGGGWWIGTEVDVIYSTRGNVYRHDLAGWRTELHPTPPSDHPISARPDWACEILSPSTASRDSVQKLRTLQAQGVPHYWLVDPVERILTVMRLGETGYVVALVAADEEVVHPEPFESLELDLGELFYAGG